MKTAYVGIKIKTDDFLNGLNPTTQPGVRLPYYPREERAMQEAQKFSSELSKPYACFVAAVEVQEVYYGKLDTLDPSAVHTLSMSVCKPGEKPNQNNTVSFSTKSQSMQEICDMARQIVTHVRAGLPMREAVDRVRYAQDGKMAQEHTAGTGDRPGDQKPAFNSEYAAQQFAFLPEDIRKEAMDAFSSKMAVYAQSPYFMTNSVGYEAGAVTYAMQAIAESVKSRAPELSTQAYNTENAAYNLAIQHGVKWKEMEYSPEANHEQYLADHCKGMTSCGLAIVTAKYHEFFRENDAYTLPEKQALALYAAVSDIAEHRMRHVANGDLRGNDSKLLLNLREEMAQELADRELRPGELLDDNRDESDVGDDAK